MTVSAGRFTPQTVLFLLLLGAHLVILQCDQHLIRHPHQDVHGQVPQGLLHEGEQHLGGLLGHCPPTHSMLRKI
jgi:hypothetical protein